jgi:gas vesicle protein
MRPLILALHNLATHGNTEALSILLSYFNRNLDKLSLENKSDCFLLKRYYEEKTSLGKEVSEWYKWSDDILKNHNCRESNTNYNWTPLHAAVHHGDIQFVKYLASNGAQLVRDSKGKLPHEVHFWDTCTNPEIRKPKYQECVKFVKEKYDSINQDEKSIVDEHFQQMVQIILSDVKSGIIQARDHISIGIKEKLEDKKDDSKQKPNTGENQTSVGNKGLAVNALTLASGKFTNRENSSTNKYKMDLFSSVNTTYSISMFKKKIRTTQVASPQMNQISPADLIVDKRTSTLKN